MTRHAMTRCTITHRMITHCTITHRTITPHRGSTPALTERIGE